MTASEDDEFLTFCQLVQEAFISSPSGSPSEDDPADLGLRERARVFAIDPERGGEARTTRWLRLSSSELIARLFISSELVRWHYRQLRVLHANVVLDEHSSAGRAFEIYSDQPYLAPRLAPSLAYVARSESATLQFPEWFPRDVEGIKPPLIDPHFAHGYTYVLSAFDEMAGELEYVSDLRKAYRKHWDCEGRRQLLMQVLGLEAITAGRNVFGKAPPHLGSRIIKTRTKRVTKRYKIYFDLILGVDRIMNALGEWWKETDWTLEKSYLRAEVDRSRIDRRLGITFLEEGEILWELLRFYSCVLSTEERRGQTAERLLELLWIAQRDGETWKLSERFANLRSWALRTGKPDFASADQLVEIVTANVRSRDPQELLAECRSILPVYALLMALPPPAGVYRCEVGFRVLSDVSPAAAIKSVWCFSTVNFPEQLGSQDEALSLLAPLIAKQKLLSTLVVNARLREVFKAANQRTVLHHGKQSTIAAIMARNMSHNIGSHVLSHLATKEGLTTALSADLLPQEKKIELDISPVAALNAYLRTRMDFLADIATGDASGRVTLALQRDIVTTFASQKMLLRLITGIEDLRVDKKINVSIEPDAKANSDCAVSIPNGVLGAHALYVILENIVRNSAKHSSNVDKDSPIRLKLVVGRSQYSGLEEVCVFDNLGTANPKLIKRLNGSARSPGLLSDAITMETGQPKSGAWGLKEMRICAGYLRGQAPHDVDSAAFRLNADSTSFSSAPPFVEALSDADGNLGYRLYLRKPQHVLLVAPESEEPLSEATRNQLAAVGIGCTSARQLSETLSTHDFVVFMSREARDAAARYSNFRGSNLHSIRRLVAEDTASAALPRRIIDELLQDPAAIADKFVACVWKNWVTHSFAEGGSPTLVIQSDLHYTRWSEVDGVRAIFEDDKSPFTVRSVVYNKHGSRVIGSRRSSGPVDGAYSYDAFGANCPVNAILESCPRQTVAQAQLASQLTEAGAVGIIILDERLQADCPKRAGSPSLGEEFNLVTLLELSRVYMPAKKGPVGVDLDAPTLEALLAWLDLYKTKGRFTEIHFLVLHLGVLEKLFRDHQGKGNFEKERAVAQIHRWELEGVTVVVTSGRGSHGIVRSLGTRFVHLSQVSRHVLERRSKYHLCNALYAARSIPK